MLIRKINTSIWFRWMKKTSSLIEDTRKDKAQRAHTRRNSKRHIQLVSLLLLRKMVAVPLRLASRLATVVSQAVRQSSSQAVSLKFKVLVIFKILYPATCKRFVVFNAVLCVIWTSTIP